MTSDDDAAGGIFASLPRQSTRGQRAARAAVVTVLSAGCLGWIAFPPVGPLGDHSPVPACADADGTVLYADIDADGLRDKISDPGREGEHLSVTFGGPRSGSPVTASEARTWYQTLYTSRFDGARTMGTVGDFDGDGYPDLVLLSSLPDQGDIPQESMPIHEVRYGPLARDLRSSRTHKLSMPPGEVYGMRAGDIDGDGRDELSVWSSSGDGMISPRVAEQNGEGVRARTPVAQDGFPPGSESLARSASRRYPRGGDWLSNGACKRS
ncbi:VCBS repeat-containing protein [Streptomyces diacarni]|uniref:FG-GAP repeat domain-containing protein n=1 Tax=Streptomyces diacarni TaxID=2800381 RepID=UPI0033FD66DD